MSDNKTLELLSKILYELEIMNHIKIMGTARSREDFERLLEKRKSTLLTGDTK